MAKTVNGLWLRLAVLVFASAGCGASTGSFSPASTEDSGGSTSKGDSPGSHTASSAPKTSAPADPSSSPGASPGPSPGLGTAPPSSGSGGSSAAAGSSGAAGAPGTGGSGGSEPAVPNPPVETGRLTAGTWDDNLNFEFFQRYWRSMQGMQLGGLPQVPAADRLVVLVTDPGGQPVAGARVSLSSGPTAVAHTQTGADGRALFFPTWAGVEAGAALDIVVEAGGIRTTAPAKAGDLLVTVPLGASGKIAGLDVAIVIDTTGSMGDEIQYLVAELGGIATAITESYPGISQRWAYVAYRDDGDEYVSKPFAFVDDVRTFQGSFGQLQAGGGGDTPEAPERGLADMDQLGWRDGAVARVAFWVGDAPHHVGREQKLAATFLAAHDRGIHVYPVSASGADELLESSMRLGALVTGGRYLFLTNDSGIGGDHKEPTIPCYLVTSLQKAMLRMIRMEVTGAHVDPAPSDVVRTGGSPHDGRCRLSSGQDVQAL